MKKGEQDEKRPSKISPRLYQASKKPLIEIFIMENLKKYILCSPAMSPQITGTNVLKDPVAEKESSRHCPVSKNKTKD